MKPPTIDARPFEKATAPLRQRNGLVRAEGRARIPSDGTRRVMRITEALGTEDGDIARQDIFIFEKVGISPDKRVQGRFHATGIQPSFLHAPRRCELFLPDSLFHSVAED